MRALVEHRELVSGLVVAALSAGAWSLGSAETNPLPPLVAVHQPVLYHACTWTYAILLLTTPYLVPSVLLSHVYVFVVTRHPATALMPLPSYPEQRARDSPFLVMGTRLAV